MSLHHRLLQVGSVMLLALGALWPSGWLVQAQGDAITYVAPAQAADVSFTPSTAVVEVGTPFTMAITIAEATDLGGFEFDLLFDSAAITITHVALGDFLGSTGNTVAALGPDLMEDGRLTFGAFSYGDHEGAGGQGDLAALELILLRDAETVLNLADVQLVTVGAEPAPVGTVGEGSVVTGYVVHLPLVLR